MFKYPLTLAPNGTLLMSEDPIADQILALIDCRYWERCMFADFGVPDITFDATDPANLSSYLARLKTAIDYWVATDCTVTNLTDNRGLEDGGITISVEIPNQPGPYLFTLNP